MFTCRIDSDVSLGLMDVRYSQELFALIDRSRSYLREWLPWLDGTQSVHEIENFIKSSLRGYAEQKSLTTVILMNEKVAGVAGYNTIDKTNRIAYIGYWLGESYQGQGIMTRVCRFLTQYAINDLGLNKVSIHVADGNIRSQRIPERLGYTQEGTIRQSEWLYDHFVDHIVYGMLAEDWTKSHQLTT